MNIYCMRSVFISIVVKLPPRDLSTLCAGLKCPFSEHGMSVCCIFVPSQAVCRLELLLVRSGELTHEVVEVGDHLLVHSEDLEYVRCIAI